jgi:hypothetical protein
VSVLVNNNNYFFLFQLGQLDKMQEGSELWRYNKKYMMTLDALCYIFYQFSSTTNIQFRATNLKIKFGSQYAWFCSTCHIVVFIQCDYSIAKYWKPSLIIIRCTSVFFDVAVWLFSLFTNLTMHLFFKFYNNCFILVYPGVKKIDNMVYRNYIDRFRNTL